MFWSWFHPNSGQRMVASTRVLTLTAVVACTSALLPARALVAQTTVSGVVRDSLNGRPFAGGSPLRRRGMRDALRRATRRAVLFFQTSFQGDTFLASCTRAWIRWDWMR